MSLEKQADCTKSKTWVLPLSITVMVDDPEKYDSKMKIVVDRVINELRGVTKVVDARGQHLILEAGTPVKNPNEEALTNMMQAGLSTTSTPKESEKINERLAALEQMILDKNKGA